MPILPSTLDHQLSNLSTSEIDEVKSNKQTFADVFITRSDNDGAVDSSDESSQDSSVHAVSPATPRFQKTKSKIMEEQGLMADEPLLKENPHRFVIFPIQDNDVSLLFISLAHLELWIVVPDLANSSSRTI